MHAVQAKRFDEFPVEMAEIVGAGQPIGGLGRPEARMVGRDHVVIRGQGVEEPKPLPAAAAAAAAIVQEQYRRPRSAAQHGHLASGNLERVGFEIRHRNAGTPTTAPPGAPPSPTSGATSGSIVTAGSGDG